MSSPGLLISVAECSIKTKNLANPSTRAIVHSWLETDFSVGRENKQDSRGGPWMAFVGRKSKFLSHPHILFLCKFFFVILLYSYPITKKHHTKWESVALKAGVLCIWEQGLMHVLRGPNLFDILPVSATCSQSPSLSQLKMDWLSVAS